MDFRASLEHTGPGIGNAGDPCLPVLREKIAALRPTQFAVGYREVCAKQERLDTRYGPDGRVVAQKRFITVVAGPGGQCYLRDGHHLALALHLAGCSSVLVTIIADLSEPGRDGFWHALKARNWVRSLDGSGCRQSLRQMPASILGVEYDPFRSLAGALRRCGAYAKSDAPYADFTWADFLRCRIAPDFLARDFTAALAQASGLAASRLAAHLPGWRGSNASGVPLLAPPSPAPDHATLPCGLPAARRGPE